MIFRAFCTAPTPFMIPPHFPAPWISCIAAPPPGKNPAAMGATTFAILTTFLSFLPSPLRNDTCDPPEHPGARQDGSLSVGQAATQGELLIVALSALERVPLPLHAAPLPAEPVLAQAFDPLLDRT